MNAFPRWRTAALAALLAAGVLPAVHVFAGQPRGCARSSSGGEWRSYNHDLSNSRHQPDEKTITPGTAASLAPAWVFSDDSGTFEATPTVADGCVFLGSSGGSVIALNADTGQVVWKTAVGDPIQSSPTVANGRVYASASKSSAPYMVALDQHTGAPIWRTQLDKQEGSDTFASPVAFNGMVMGAISGAGAEAGTTICPPPFDTTFGCGGGGASRLRFRGSYQILDAATGRMLSKGYSIPDADFKKGFAGGGIWSTPAVDLKAKYAYVGTGNPFSAIEHDNTNAIIKIDVDRHRKTFGTVVGSYHGTNDLYVPGELGRVKPVCQVYVDVFTCDPPDFDFGASPQLFNAGGRTLVGAMQKAGVYHAADRATMKPAWQTIVGGPFGQFGGEATAAYDGHSLLAAGSAPGLLNALSPGDGATSWMTPIADGIHFQSVSSAGGVVYTTDTRGFFDAWDASSGTPLFVRPLGPDTGQTTYTAFSSGASIAIARHTVFVPAGSYLVAYRLPQ